MNSFLVREKLVEALKLDLVGPTDGLGATDEVLPQPPSRWYLTGFLVPQDAEVQQKADEASNGELDEVSDAHGLDDAAPPEPAAARQRYLPSSIGVSVLVPANADRLQVVVRWGDYRLQKGEEEHGGPSEWKRQTQEELLTLAVPEKTVQPAETDLSKSDGLQVVVSVRPVHCDGDDGGLPVGARSVSAFFVNRRALAPDVRKDEAFAFQAQLEVMGAKPFIARPNLRSLESEDWDERVADLQYHNACEFAVGHSVATEEEKTAIWELGNKRRRRPSAQRRQGRFFEIE